MNSMAVLLLLETLAKFGMLALFAQAGLPAPVPRPPEKDFGWQVGQDGALEYIVQITPNDAQIMMSQTAENASQMPAELVGRATRIVVRIGNNDLPRTPSLEQIERDFPVYNTPSDITAALGPGRVSDVEGAVLPVQNGNGSGLPLPALPNPTLDSVTSSINNQANAALDRMDRTAEQLGNSFLNETRQPTLPPSNTPVGGLAGAGNPGGAVDRFGTQPPTTTPQLPSTLPATPGVDRWTADNTGRNQSTTLPPATDPRALGDPYASVPPQGGAQYPAGQYAPNAPSTSQRDPYAPNLAQRGQMPGRSLSEAVPGAGGYGYANDRFNNTGDYAGGAPAFNQGTQISTQGSAGGFAGQSGISSNPAQDPNYYGNIAQREQRATPRDDLAASTVGDRKTVSDKSIEEEDSPSNKGAASNTTARRSGSENFLQVFFLLSLVVNFYLGMLIRKLLARYRSLLASVRSQAA